MLCSDHALASFNVSQPGQPSPWKVLPPRKVNPKNFGELEIVEVINRTSHPLIMSDTGKKSVEGIIKENLEAFRSAGRYTPLSSIQGTSQQAGKV
jgi:hypothetical protein